MKKKPVKVIAICSGKGGVGKTNVAANLAVALGSRGRNTCLLDADMSLANVDVLLGLQPRFNLSHVVSGDAACVSDHEQTDRDSHQHHQHQCGRASLQ